MKRVWWIRNAAGDFWNNDQGWCENQFDATTFYDDERDVLNLPVEGFWEVDPRSTDPHSYREANDD